MQQPEKTTVPSLMDIVQRLFDKGEVALGLMLLAALKTQ